MANNDERINRNLIVPVTATTRWDSTSLKWTVSGRAEAIYIPLRPLSVDERKDLICDLATRVALHHGRPKVTQEDLPDALENDALDIVGGNPRLVTWLLEGIGGYSWSDERSSWATAFDLAVKSMTRKNLLGVVKGVKRKAMGQLNHERLISLTKSPEDKKRCLQVVVATMILDRAVWRTNLVEALSLGVKLPVSWGELEGDGIVELVPLLGIGTSEFRAAASSSEPRLLQDPASSPLSSPSTSPPLALLPAPSSSSPPATAGLLASASSPLATPPRRAFKDSPRSSPYRVLQERGPGEVLVRDETGLLASVTIESGKNISPAKLGTVMKHALCPEPTTEPGQEPVHVTMGFFLFSLLLERMELIRDEDLSVFSESMIRESSLDKENTDIMAIALKLQALHLLGERTFGLKAAFPGLRVPADVRSKRFLVPPGPLTAGEGGRVNAQVSKEELLAKVAEIARKTRERVNSGRWGTDSLDIGLVGPGNFGWDAFVVLLEDSPSRDPWVLFTESKQETSPKPGYATLKDVLRNLESDLRDTPYGPPSLPSEWVQWLNDGKEEQAQTGGSHAEKANVPGGRAEQTLGVGKGGRKGVKRIGEELPASSGGKKAGKLSKKASVPVMGLGKEEKKRAKRKEGEEPLASGGEIQAPKRRKEEELDLDARGKGREHTQGDDLAPGDMAGKGAKLREADKLPDQAFGSESWTSNVIYIYVSDRRFSQRQLDLLRKVEEKGHPWLRRLIIVSKESQNSWYSRIGALGRAATLRRMSEKLML
eukprot:TRINITY_DN10231_c0_g6_i1.p1 TRINITY_DN10231_c0_g6~~TRINITY_DN10231_c0_g6_i1.p1  ORF type:complete len:862 (+),score=122.26 TRINITY_DN10231_c0_g6_i1:277-2586(+)